MQGIRFAPSPTGRLHLGNLRTAWISKILADEFKEKWILRFEDIDTPRVIKGAVDQQLEDLRLLGLIPDEWSLQSAGHSRHFEIFEKAVQEKRVYPCDCSRKKLKEYFQSAPQGEEGAPLYSGACRHRDFSSFPSLSASERPMNWRLFFEEDASGRSDFLVARSPLILSELTFQPSYHWACAFDDWEGDYALLVRALDLYPVARLHRRLYRLFSELTGIAKKLSPIFHTALVVGEDGQRLEKRSQDVTLKEVRGRGFGVQKIGELFQRSFDLTTAISHIRAFSINSAISVSENHPSDAGPSAFLARERRATIKLGNWVFRERAGDGTLLVSIPIR